MSTLPSKSMIQQLQRVIHHKVTLLIYIMKNELVMIGYDMMIAGLKKFRLQIDVYLAITGHFLRSIYWQ